MCVYRRGGWRISFTSFNAVFRVYIYIGETHKGNELFKQFRTHPKVEPTPPTHEFKTKTKISDTFLFLPFTKMDEITPSPKIQNKTRGEKKNNNNNFRKIKRGEVRLVDFNPIRKRLATFALLLFFFFCLFAFFSFLE